MPDNFCPSCGAPARPGARFCPSCGQAADSGARTAPTPAPAPAPMQTPTPVPPPGGGAMPFQATWPAPPRSQPRPRSAVVLQGAILALLIFAVGAVGFVSITLMGEADRVLYHEGVESLGAAASMGEDFATLRSVLRDMCIDTDPAANRAQKEQMGKGRASLRDSMKVLQDSARTSPDKRTMVEEVARAMEAYFKVTDVAMDLAMANRNAEAVQWLRGAAVPASSAFREDLAELKAFMHDYAEHQMKKNVATSANSRIALALCLVAAIALAAVTTAALAAARR